MTRDELIALRNAIDATLPLPDSVRVMLARWLAPEAAPRPGNGLDHDPPPVAAKPRPARPVRHAKGHGGEKKLLEAVRTNPGASANALAKASGMSRSTVQLRLKRLGERGAIERSSDGRWRLAGEEAGRPPMQASPS